MPSPRWRDPVRAWRRGSALLPGPRARSLQEQAGLQDPPQLTTEGHAHLQVFLRVARPVRSGIAKWVYRHISQEVCPVNRKFARELSEDSPFQPRDVLRGKDSRTLARELLAMSQEELSAAFRKSPMKRAKLQGLKRNAAVVLENVGTVEDVEVLERALDDPEPLVREHAAWALDSIRARGSAG